MPELSALAWQEKLAAFVAARDDLLGFGVAKAGPAPSSERLRHFLAQGHAAGMDYMARQVEERLDPRRLAPWARSVVLFAMRPASPLRQPAASRPHYAVAAYARGEDYHPRARRHLAALEAELQSLDGGLQFRGFADTSPVFERDFAAEAGLGWRAKNCTLIDRRHGSHFLLFGCLLSIELPPSPPVESFCGGCTRCLDACPTSAFTAPGELDARRCISYWTIEHRGDLPPDLSPHFESWIFGCDRCQTVCPWNHKHLMRDEIHKESQDGFERSGPSWLSLLQAGGGEQGSLKSHFKHSPLMRAGRKGLLRNVIDAARRQGDVATLPQLRAHLANENDPGLRQAMAQAIASLEALECKADGAKPEQGLSDRTRF